jgi:hypothetical protein
VSFVLPRHGHKEKEIGGKVSWLEENTLETRPVKTIELMKTPKDNRCAQVRTHAKGYLLDGKEKWQCQTKMIKRKVYCQMWR